MPRPAPTEAPRPRPDPDTLFTDREREREILAAVLSTEPTPAEHRDRFLTTFYGVAGVGKSALAAQARLMAGQHPDVTLVTLDFDTSGWTVDSSWVALAGELVRAFAQAGVTASLATVLLTLHALHVVRRGGDGAEARDIGLEILDKGAEFTQDLPGLGTLLRLAKWMYDRARRKEAEFTIQDLGLWPIERGGCIDLQDLERKITLALFEDLRSFLTSHSARCLRLLVDGFDRIQSYDRRVDAQMHLHDLLGYCAASPDRQAFDRLRVMVFGREKLRWNVLYEVPDWQQCWQQIRLKGLSERDARNYLQAWEHWFECREQNAAAGAVADSEDDILRASDEGGLAEREFSPFYLAGC